MKETVRKVLHILKRLNMNMESLKDLHATVELSVEMAARAGKDLSEIIRSDIQELKNLIPESLMLVGPREDLMKFSSSAPEKFPPKKAEVLIGGKKITGYARPKYDLKIIDDPPMPPRFTFGDESPYGKAREETRRMVGKEMARRIKVKVNAFPQPLSGMNLGIPIRMLNRGSKSIKGIKRELDQALNQAERDGTLEPGAAKRAAKGAKFTVESSDTIGLSLNGTKASSRSSRTASRSGRARRSRQNARR